MFAVIDRADAPEQDRVAGSNVLAIRVVGGHRAGREGCLGSHESVSQRQFGL